MEFPFSSIGAFLGFPHFPDSAVPRISPIAERRRLFCENWRVGRFELPVPFVSNFVVFLRIDRFLPLTLSEQ